MLTLLLSVVVRTTAGPVTADAALKKAKAFMAARNAGKSEGLALAKDNKRRSVKGNETEADTYYYIFNNEQQGGFVIVSADDATEQILAYSDDGYFDVNDIPEGVQELLDGYQKEIRYVRINELIPDDPTPVLEDETAKQAIAPYLSTLWGQGKPYNQECFTQEGDTAVTGCVATAMAQIMYYHKWPQDFTQPIPGYGTLKTLPAAHFNWQQMKDSYATDASFDGKFEVARLMRYCGQAVEMEYGVKSSGAITGNAVNAMKNLFGYGSSIDFVNRTCFDVEEWDNIIYNELYHGRPVIYSASNTKSGHAFVCDGYDGKGLFHINWGWDGLRNGYYRLQALFPRYNETDLYKRSNTGCYSNNQAAIIGISPEDNIVSPFTDIVKAISAHVESIIIQGSSQISYTSGSDFSGIQLILNYSAPSDASLSYGLGLFRGDEMIDSIVTYESLVIPHGYSYNSYTSLSGLGKGLADGTYSIRCISKLSDSDTWLCNNGSDRVFIGVTIRNGKAVFTSYNTSQGISITRAWRTSFSTARFLKVVFHNQSQYEYQGPAYLYINGTSTIKETLNIMGGEDETVYFELCNESDDDLIQVLMPENGAMRTVLEQVAGRLPWENISTEDDKVEVVATSVRGIDNQKMKAYGSRLEATVTVKNTAETACDYNVSLSLYQYAGQVGSSPIESRLTYQYVTLAPGETRDIIIGDTCLTPGDEVWYTLRYGSRVVNGGNSSKRYTVTKGYAAWNARGEQTGLPYGKSITVPEDVVAVSFEGLQPYTIIPNSNPNTLYIFDEGTTIPSQLRRRNIVEGYKVKGNLTLTDGYEYYIPRTLTVEGTVSYSRTMAMGSDGYDGWQTICLPFAVENVMNVTDKKDIDWMHHATDNGKQFCVKQFTGISGGKVSFDYLDKWIPNEPYIMAVPGEAFGSRSLEGKEIAFSARDTKVIRTAVCQKVTSTLALRGCTATEELKNHLVMNGDGLAFETVDLTTVKPFEAYFMPIGYTPLPDYVSLGSSGLHGDANGDGYVDITDVVLIADYMLGKSSSGFIHSNLKKQGEGGSIDIGNLIEVIKIVIGN